MAADEVLLESVRAGKSPATLRLYVWDHPTVSLGRTQAVERPGRRHLPAIPLDWPVVIRPTGGRALLHGTGDLTYAVVIPDEAGFPQDVRGAYCAIARWTSRALARVGLEGQLEQGSQDPDARFDCLAVATEADLVVEGIKRVASAQLRRPGAFLQHGALWIDVEPVELSPVLASGAALPEGLTAPSRSRLTEVAQAFTEEAQALWGITIRDGEWLESEREAIHTRLDQASPSIAGRSSRRA